MPSLTLCSCSCSRFPCGLHGASCAMTTNFPLNVTIYGRICKSVSVGRLILNVQGQVGQRTGADPTKPAPGWPHQLRCAGLSVGPWAGSLSKAEPCAHSMLCFCTAAMGAGALLEGWHKAVVDTANQQRSSLCHSGGATPLSRSKPLSCSRIVSISKAAVSPT